MKAERILRSRLSKIVAAVALLCVFSQASAVADVTDSSAEGFTVKVVVDIHASPAEVYKKLVHNIGDWWSPAHTFSGDPHNLSIDERPMGCFCEKLPNQGAVRHMEVVYYSPGKILRLSGGMGPMQSIAASAVTTFSLSPSDDGTSLTLVFTIGGYTPKGLTSLAPIVNTVMTEQMTRLKNYVETGDPEGNKK